MKKILITCFAFVLLINHSVFSQNKAKEINRQSQIWVSINSCIKVNNKWTVLADVHMRRNHFLKDGGFYFVRIGIGYNISKDLLVAAGYAHLWLAPATSGWKTYINENRIYQQLQFSTSIGKINLLQRLRNEQRWQQKILNDKPTGQNRFTNRIRYLLNVTIPVFKKQTFPSLVVSDELHIQFGKEVLYNTFDQNRLFLGIKQKINKRLVFDLGYMQVLQQKFSGYQYDLNNTFRCFFYYSPYIQKKKPTS